jgi:hypothetical protein
VITVYGAVSMLDQTEFRPVRVARCGPHKNTNAQISLSQPLAITNSPHGTIISAQTVNIIRASMASKLEYLQRYMSGGGGGRPPLSLQSRSMRNQDAKLPVGTRFRLHRPREEEEEEGQEEQEGGGFGHARGGRRRSVGALGAQP